MLTAALLSLASLTCQQYAESVQTSRASADLRDLSLLADVCSESLDADTVATLQFCRCVMDREGRVRCTWWLYGRRRLPFEPQVAR